MVVMRYPLSDGILQFPGEVIVFQLDHVLHGSVVAFDLALSHRMVGCTTSMLHVLVLQPLPELFGDIAGPVIREQPRSMMHPGFSDADRSGVLARVPS